MAQSTRYNVTRYEVMLLDVVVFGPFLFVDIITVEVEIYELDAANDNDGDFALDPNAATLHSEPIPESDPDQDFVLSDLSPGENALFVAGGQVYNTVAPEDGTPERPFTLPVEDGSPEAPFTLELVEDGSPERPFTLQPDATTEVARKRRNPDDCDVVLVWDGKDGVTTAVNPRLDS